jgi:hypothetical protein
MEPKLRPKMNFSKFLEKMKNVRKEGCKGEPWEE